MTSDVRYEIKTSLPVIWPDLTEKSASVRLNEHEHNKLFLVLVDPVDDEDVEEIIHELIQ